jgi:hypothetical protein
MVDMPVGNLVAQSPCLQKNKNGHWDEKQTIKIEVYWSIAVLESLKFVKVYGHMGQDPAYF